MSVTTTNKKKAARLTVRPKSREEPPKEGKQDNARRCLAMHNL